MKTRVLVTGGTGFLGPSVTREFGDSCELTLISRRGSPSGFKADLTEWNAGISDEDIKRLRGKFDVMLHMAGLYDLRVAVDDAHLHNVAGTHTALALSQQLEIPAFVHISTVAVTMGYQRLLTSRQKSIQRAGSRDFVERRGFYNDSSSGDENSDILNGVPPDRLFRGPFPDAYAESKTQAEKMVRGWDATFPQRKLILRPGIIVGDTEGHPIGRIDGPYHAIESFRRLRKVIELWRGPIYLPGHQGQKVPLVPVDYAARAIASLLHHFLKTDSRVESYYVAPSNGPTLIELYKSALGYLGINRAIELADRVPDLLVKPVSELIARLPREELEYVLNLPKLDTTATERVLGADFFPRFEKYDNKLWSGYHAYLQNR